MSHELHIGTSGRRIGHITYDATDDVWALRYADDWTADPAAFSLSPALPLALPDTGYSTHTIKRFVEHLLPEGRALDVAVQYNGLARSNIFGLVRALGSDSAGALRFVSDAHDLTHPTEAELREIGFPELNQRIEEHEQIPFSVWDGKVRMSVAGLQDKLLVYLDRTLAEGGKMYLVDGGWLASTHILKPDPGNAQGPHVAVNEHFCMSLAHRMGLPAAEVHLLRVPRPVLLVSRFDRDLAWDAGGIPFVRRLHIVDACQACDLPVSFKYERNLGSAQEVRHIREGVSFERLFGCSRLAENVAAARLDMLRWALFQFVIGNSDAHGKNYSFFVRPGGLLQPAGWYDLVSVRQYPRFDHELAMAYGDIFRLEEVSAFALADFATRCGIDRGLMQREGLRMAKMASLEAPHQAHSGIYLDDEMPFVDKLATFVREQAKRLSELVKGAATIKAEYL